MKAVLVTCSYRPDYEKCADLCASASRHVEGMEHVLVVPARDRRLFQKLAGPGRRVVDAEALLGGRLTYLPQVHSRLWATRGGGLPRPVRGWLVQQILKVAAADAVEADVIVHADSDVFFVAPFAVDRVVDGGRVRLWHEPGGGRLPTHLRWHGSARSLLGIGGHGYTGADYIHQLVSWRRDAVLGMRARIEEVTGMPWQDAVIRAHHFAEYVSYGVYATRLLAGAGHVPDTQERCLCSWSFDLSSPAGMATFVRGLGPQHAAVLIQSTERLSAARRRDILSEIAPKGAAWWQA